MGDAGTVEVRIRYESEVSATRLTSWPIDDLAGILRKVDEWGTAEGNGDGACGQWGLAPGAAYFEVIVPDGDS